MVFDSAIGMSTNGQFVVPNQIKIKPGSYQWVKYQLDWGVNIAIDAQVSASCQASVSAELGAKIYLLVIGGQIKGTFTAEASCQAALKATASAYTGIIRGASVVGKYHFEYDFEDAKLSYTPHISTKPGAIVVSAISATQVNITSIDPQISRYQYAYGGTPPTIFHVIVDEYIAKPAEEVENKQVTPAYLVNEPKSYFKAPVIDYKVSYQYY